MDNPAASQQPQQLQQQPAATQPSPNANSQPNNVAANPANSSASSISASTSSSGQKGNSKNLSIKEFFTTRLMRTKSFEGGQQQAGNQPTAAPPSHSNGQDSPKDESTNWFEEFKAKMINKKSPANNSSSSSGGAGKQTVKQDNCDNTNLENLTENIAEEELEELASIRKENNNLSIISKRFAYSKNKKDRKARGLVRKRNIHLISEEENQLFNLKDDDDDDDDDDQDDDDQDDDIDDGNELTDDDSLIDDDAYQQYNGHFVDNLDFTSSSSFKTRGLIKDLTLNRSSSSIRSSYYNSLKSLGLLIRSQFQRIFVLLGSLISYLIPFNYNLPWKLLSLINFCFVLIVIFYAKQTKPDVKALSFFNGFLSGLLMASFIFLLVIISLVYKFLPKTPSGSSSLQQQFKDSNNSMTRKSRIDLEKNSIRSASIISRQQQHQQSITSGIGSDTWNSMSELSSKDQEEYSTFEVLDGKQVNNSGDGNNNVDHSVVNHDYKGWMIEFIGDYEHRSKSELFKLKNIYVKLEDKILYLCKPKNSHDVQDSQTFPSSFVQQRIYNLGSATKFSASLLLPKNVRNTQKWVWSKKYPIRLEFQDETATIQPTPKSSSSSSSGPSSSSITSSQNDPNSTKQFRLTLFAKCGREKEEWFRRFKRIIEENMLAQSTNNHKKFSFQSDISENTDNTNASTATGTASNYSSTVGLGVFGSLKSFRCRSPSPGSKSTNIQSSKSSHLLNELSGKNKYNKESDDNKSSAKVLDSNDTTNNSMNLTRTKSCELINDQLSSAPTKLESSSERQSKDKCDQGNDGDIVDEGTLTRETAELFSQGIELSNFLDNQPTLDYREYIERIIDSTQDATPTSNWFNALTGRIFFDVLSRECWSVWFKRKIQRKLYRIRLPYFMETLTLSEIDLGTNAPQFLNVVSHRFDSFGLSVDFDMTYSGGLCMTFETKLNLLKFRNDNSSSGGVTNTSSTSDQQQPSVPLSPSTSAQPASASNVSSATSTSSSPSLTATSSAATLTSGSNNSNTFDTQQNQNSTSHQQNVSENQSNENVIRNINITSDGNTTKQQQQNYTYEGANTNSKDRIRLQQPIISTTTITTTTSSSTGGSSTRTSEESSDSCDSDSTSSSDSSCDEADVDEISDWEDYGAEKTRQNIVKFVDKIASSRYFQHATENRYIKKKLLDISNCPLVLIVRIESLSGILTVNVPPPQTDRIWYGFKPNPELTIKALPKMGDREVNLTHVTDWIEKKLAEEFRKILVIPNMEDIVLPVLKSDHSLYITTTR